MAVVTFKLNSMGLVTMSPLAPTVDYLPSGPAVFGPYMFASKPIRATLDPDGETFTANLAPSDITSPPVWYTLRITWLDAAGNFTTMDTPGWKIQVPDDGGDLSDLVDAPLASPFWWVTTAPADPPGSKLGDFIMNPTTGDVDRII